VNSGYEDPRSVRILPDGGILVSGENNLGVDDDFLVMKFNADGSLQTDFADGGVLQTDHSASGNDDAARDIAVLPDGKILAIGRAFNVLTGNMEILLVRLLENGMPDPGFGIAGVIKYGISGTDFFMANITPLDGGQFILAGRINDFEFGDIALAKFNEDGTPDISFGDNGFVFHDVFGSFDTEAGTALLPGNEIVISGWGYNPLIGEDQMYLVKFLSNGDPDTDFGVDGEVLLPDFGGEETYRDVVFNGTHLIAGGYITQGGLRDIIISKFDLSGALDPGFGTDGHVILDYGGGDDNLSDLHLQADGKIIGSVNVAGATPDVGLIRLLSDGTLDPGFNFSGWFVVDFSPDDNVFDINIQPDGKILMSGVVHEDAPEQDFVLARVIIDGETGVVNVQENELEVFPNPTDDLLYCRPANNDPTEIFDLSGKMVHREEQLLHGQISVAHLAPGMYIIKTGNFIGKFVRK